MVQAVIPPLAPTAPKPMSLIAYDSLGNYGKAIEYQEQRLAIAREIKAHSFVDGIHFNVNP